MPKTYVFFRLSLSDYQSGFLEITHSLHHNSIKKNGCFCKGDLDHKKMCFQIKNALDLQSTNQGHYWRY